MSGLAVRSCNQCGKAQFAPAAVCRYCGSQALNDTEVAGEGTLYSYTIIHVPPEGWQESVPYTVGVVTLDNGLKSTAKFNGKIEDIPALGARVKIWPEGEGFLFQ